MTLDVDDEDVQMNTDAGGATSEERVSRRAHGADENSALWKEKPI